MSDKRQVRTDALGTLGTLIGENEKRDAIHLAVIPVKAGQDLSPGESIRALNGVAWPSIGGVDLPLPHLVHGSWLVRRRHRLLSLHWAASASVRRPGPGYSPAARLARRTGPYPAPGRR